MAPEIFTGKIAELKMSQMKGSYISQVRLGLPLLPDLLCHGLCQVIVDRSSRFCECVQKQT